MLNYSTSTHSLLYNMIISGETLGVPIHVFGPETHMTAIVGMALGRRALQSQPKKKKTTANFCLENSSVCGNDNDFCS